MAKLPPGRPPVERRARPLRATLQSPRCNVPAGSSTRSIATPDRATSWTLEIQVDVSAGDYSASSGAPQWRRVSAEA